MRKKLHEEDRELPSDRAAHARRAAAREGKIAWRKASPTLKPANQPRAGATKLKPSGRGRKRKAQPRKAHPYAPEPDIRLFDIQAKTHVAHGTAKHAPCKLVVRYAGGKKQFGVYYGKRPKPQMFNSKEAAERFQKECKRAHGIKGLGTMAKKKSASCKKLYHFHGRDYTTANAAARAAVKFMVNNKLVRSFTITSACKSKRGRKRA